MEIIYNKLVRDNIPDICEANNEKAVTRILSDWEYWECLLKKDAEELEEVKLAQDLDERKKELADKLEVLRAMAEFNGFTLEEILKEAQKKKLKNGGFNKRIFLEKVLK